MNQRQQLIEQIRQQSIQKRAQALREAAQRQANNAPIANAAAGASSGGGRRGCTERDGLTMTWKSPESEPGFTLIQRAFLPYTGQDESGNATFGLVTDRFIFDSEEGGEFIVRVSKSGDQWLLEFFLASIEGTQVVVAAQSSDLYEGWIGLEYEDEGQILQDITATCGDQTYRKLCITTQLDSPFGPSYTTTSGGIETIVPEVSEEYPSGYGGSNRSSLFWDPEGGAWIVGRTIVREANDISQPPTGQFESGSSQITIVEGSCTGDVPTPPEPTLVTTSDIQLSETTWNWNSFSGAGESGGSIGSFLIDGQPGYVEGGGGLPPLSTYVFQTTPGVGPNQYTITLLPSASGKVQLGIGMTSYNLVSMVLNITTDGTSPISGGSTGVITFISGTITYEA
jgi:hypothetical protein